MRDLAELQNLVKRDKESYHQEFLLQFRHYLSELEIFKFNPAVHSSSFCDLVNFLSQVNNFSIVNNETKKIKNQTNNIKRLHHVTQVTCRNFHNNSPIYSNNTQLFFMQIPESH